MSGSTFGNKFKITTWGESHGKALGVVVDGCPAGLPLTEDDIQVYLNRRRPGFSQFSTPRKESDQVEILSGVFEGKTTGTPISLMVRNTSQRSGDYGDIATIVRDMLIIPSIKNMVFAITVVAAVPPAEKQSAELPPVRSLQRS